MRRPPLLIFIVLSIAPLGCRPREWPVSWVFGGETNAQIVAAPISVTAWRTAAWFKGDGNFASHELYEKVGSGTTVTGGLAARLSATLTNKRSYDLTKDRAKSSIPFPSIVLTFSNANSGLDIFLSFADNTVQVTRSGPGPNEEIDVGGGDFDPARAEILRIVKQIFPTDERIQALSETRADGYLWPRFAR